MPIILIDFFFIENNSMLQTSTREPQIYGSTTLQDVENEAKKQTTSLSIQSNHEGAIVDRIHQARGQAGYIVINALIGVSIPFMEVHITNIHKPSQSGGGDMWARRVKLHGCDRLCMPTDEKRADMGWLVRSSLTFLLQGDTQLQGPLHANSSSPISFTHPTLMNNPNVTGV